MNKTLVTLSIEEFGFALASLGAEDIAAGLLKPMYGQLSEQQWEVILRAASHSLLSKGLITKMEETEIELEQEFLRMLSHFAQSRRMMRAYTDSQGQEKVLTIHQGANNNDIYLFHLAIDQRVHLFTWTEPAEWEEELLAFYAGQQGSFLQQPTRFTLTEEQWNLLTDEEKHMPLEPLMSEWTIPEDEKVLIQVWHKAFEASGRNVDNLSVIGYADDDIPLPDRALLLLNTSEGIWSISNSSATSDPQLEIEISQVSDSSFRAQLRKWIDDFASPVVK